MIGLFLGRVGGEARYETFNAFGRNDPIQLRAYLFLCGHCLVVLRGGDVIRELQLGVLDRLLRCVENLLNLAVGKLAHLFL